MWVDFDLTDTLIDGPGWCGLLWCFYQLFALSFWRHPFTADDPLVSEWYYATFPNLIPWRNKHILDALRVYFHRWVDYSFNYCCQTVYLYLWLFLFIFLFVMAAVVHQMIEKSVLTGHASRCSEVKQTFINLKSWFRCLGRSALYSVSNLISLLYHASDI